MPLPSRIIDYFCCLRVAKEEIEFNQGRFKQIGLPLINGIRYPLRDYKDFEFPSDLGCFAFPNGVKFERKCLEKSSYSFVLTEGDGGRIYCQALRYWKEISFNDLQIYCELYKDYDSECIPHFNVNDNNTNNGTGNEYKLYEPFIICIVSHWPFLYEFELILNKIYLITLNNNNKLGLPYPIEKFLINLIYEIPLPPRGRKQVEYNCYNKRIIFKRPSPNQLPLRCNNGNGKYINILFHTLSLQNILTIIIAMLCEKRILFYSSNISILTPCIESLCTLIFPFYWQHIYVPVLPSKFTDFIYAPMPFICGVLPSYLPDLSLLEGVVFIDLDENVVKFHSSDPIPKFQRLSNNKDINKLVSNPKKPLNINIKINNEMAMEFRNIFIKFFAKFLKSYKINMMPSTGPSKDKFNKEKWINTILNENKSKSDSEKEKDLKFLNLFVESQLFQCFIDERFDASLNINNYEVLYFDEKIDEIIHNKSTPFLLDTTFLHKINDIYRVPIPNINDINEKEFNYIEFPLSLNEKYFGKIRKNKIEILVSEEDLNNNQQPSMHISWMSVEFFKQKKLYDRHWHSLESRINSQNILFRQILTFFMKWQDSNNKYIKDLDNITHSLLMIIIIH